MQIDTSRPRPAEGLKPLFVGSDVYRQPAFEATALVSAFARSKRALRFTAYLDSEDNQLRRLVRDRKGLRDGRRRRLAAATASEDAARRCIAWMATCRR